MRAVRTEADFIHQEDGILVAAGFEVRGFEPVVIVLQAEFGELRWIPGEIGGQAVAALALRIVGDFGWRHVDVIAAQACGPAFVETPDDLGISAPVIEGFRSGEAVIESPAGLISPEHRLALPFHERPTTFRVGGFPFVEQIGAVDLGAGVFAGVIGSESRGDSTEDRLGGGDIKRCLEAWREDQIRQAVGLPVDRLPGEEGSVNFLLRYRLAPARRLVEASRTTAPRTHLR